MIGSFSDIYGRRPFLLVTVLITSAQVWTIALYPNISLYYYLVAKAFGKISVFGPVLSYVADCTTTEYDFCHNHIHYLFGYCQ
jgi:MFS family permease